MFVLFFVFCGCLLGTKAIECVFCDHCADPSSQDKETCSQGADLCTVVTSLNDDGSQTVHRGCLHRVSEIDYCHEGIVHNRNGDKIIEQLYRCCDEYDLCNRNLTALRFNSTSSITITSTLQFDPTVTTTPNLAVILPSTLVPLIVIGGLLCVLMCIILPMKIKRNKRSHRSLSLQNHTDNGNVMLNDPVSVTMMSESITETSGSGSGLPRLVPRTIARSITLSYPIGNGRFGQVYVGTYQGEMYAVKKFTSRDEESWFRECEIYNNFNIRHETILSCFATDTISNNGVTELWLITQYHPNGSLFDVLNRDILDIETAISYAVSSCRGIAYLHTELVGNHGKPSVAHRDIKSKNILVKNDNTCCIADFGLAVTKGSNNTHYMSMPQNICQGTKRYMAPEVLAETIDVSNFESFLRTDMYSFGLVLWEIFRNCSRGKSESSHYELPFQDSLPAPNPSFEEMRAVVVDKGIVPTIPNHWANEEVLKYIGDIMLECWAHEPAARPTAALVKKKLFSISKNCDYKLPFTTRI